MSDSSDSAFEGRPGPAIRTPAPKERDGRTRIATCCSESWPDGWAWPRATPWSPPCMHWALDKSRSLGQILTEQGVLTGVRHRLLETLVEELVRLHDDDPARSLGAVASLESTWEDLERITDPDLHASLIRVVTRGPDSAIGTRGRRG